MRISAIYLLLLLLTACSKGDEEIHTKPDLYLPGSDNQWETIDPASLGWKEKAIKDLDQWIKDSDTRALLILKDGKMAIERYAGKDLLNLQDFDSGKQWYWASAGKTLTSSMIGILEMERKLKITDKTSEHLGEGWTSMNPTQEDKITIYHQLSMTTGVDDAGGFNCTDPGCLRYGADPATRWSYNNGPYTLLTSVIEKSSGMSLQRYFATRIGDRIGIRGRWQKLDGYNLFISTPREMARFGLLVLNRGRWHNNEVIIDEEYLIKATSPSQSINPAYGYLWWLNGQSSFMLPQTQRVFSGPLVPGAPSDMLAALGKNGQMCLVIPSLNIVIVRMGSLSSDEEVGYQLLLDMWEKLLKVF